MKLALHDDLLSDTSEMKMVKVITVDMNCAYQARRGEKSQKKNKKTRWQDCKDTNQEVIQGKMRSQECVYVYAHEVYATACMRL